ncbi:MAG: hypothetical protein A2156_13450 [Deltaproteobacteria bacterium RBG_16_48_10]|nr:MAG: hypothetical protein A2156_13450 [Deltaproteobacteria bacterium RBG_16_48_10]
MKKDGAHIKQTISNVKSQMTKMVFQIQIPPSSLLLKGRCEKIAPKMAGRSGVLEKLHHDQFT